MLNILLDITSGFNISFFKIKTCKSEAGPALPYHWLCTFFDQITPDSLFISRTCTDARSEVKTPVVYIINTAIKRAVYDRVDVVCWSTSVAMAGVVTV